MPHRHHPGIHPQQRPPFRNKEKFVALCRARQECDPHRQDQEQPKKQRHKHLAHLFDPLRYAEHQHKAHQHNDRHMPGHASEAARSLVKKGFHVRSEQLARNGACQAAQHPTEDHRVADGNAKRPKQRNPAQSRAELLSPPAREAVFVRANRPRAGQPADCKLARKPHPAEQARKQKIGN